MLWVIGLRVTATLLVTSAPPEGSLTALFSLSGDATKETKDLVLVEAVSVLERSGRRAAVQGAPIEDTTLVLGCSINEAACLAQVAATLEVDDLLFGALELNGEKLRLRLVLTTKEAKTTATLDEVIDAGAGAAQIRKVLEHMLIVPEPPRVGMLTLSSTPPEAEIVIDGELKGRTPMDLVLPLGPHEVEVRQGARRELRRIDVLAAPTRAVFFLPEAALPPTGPGFFARVGAPAVTITAAGVAALAVGAILAATVGSLQSDFDARAASLPASPQAADLATLRELRALADRGQSRAVASQLTLIGGGVALLGGVLTGIIQAASSAREPTTERPGGLRGLGQSQAEVRW